MPADACLGWPEPERGPIFNDSAHLMQAAIEGQGVALARSSLLGDDVRNGLLVRLFDLELPSERSYYFVYPPRLADTPKIRMFGRWLHAEVSDGVVTRKAKGRARKR